MRCYFNLLYRHRWNTRIYPVTKIWYPVKIQFLSFTFEDITVVMATSVSASRKRASQHLAIAVYIVNRILHARLWIRILSSRVQLDMSRVSAISSWTREDKIRIHKRACNILCLLSSNSIVVTTRGGFNLFEAFYRRGNPGLVNFTTSRTDKFLGSN